MMNVSTAKSGVSGKTIIHEALSQRAVKCWLQYFWHLGGAMKAARCRAMNVNCSVKPDLKHFPDGAKLI